MLQILVIGRIQNDSHRVEDPLCLLRRRMIVQTVQDGTVDVVSRRLRQLHRGANPRKVNLPRALRMTRPNQTHSHLQRPADRLVARVPSHARHDHDWLVVLQHGDDSGNYS